VLIFSVYEQTAMQIVRIGGNIGNKALALFNYLYLDKRKLKVKLFLLESTSPLSVLQSLRPLYFLSSKQSHFQVNARQEVFRSSSIHLSKVVYYLSWGRLWLLSLLFFSTSSFVLALTIKILWILMSQLEHKKISASKIGSLIKKTITNWDGNFNEDFEDLNSNGYLLSKKGFEHTQRKNQKVINAITKASLRFSPAISTISTNKLFSNAVSEKHIDRVVAITFRTPYYLNGNDNTQRYRDSSHESFCFLADGLVRSGYIPVFFGSYSPLVKSKLRRSALLIEDLALPKGYDEVCLVRDCRLVIHTASGPSVLPALFGKEALVVDYPFFTGAEWPCEKSTFMMKHYWSSNESRFLSAKEIMSVNMLFAQNSGDLAVESSLDKHGLTLYSNKGPHILESALSMLEGRQSASVLLQEEANKICFKYLKQHFEDYYLSGITNASYVYRIYSSATGKPASSFANALYTEWCPR